MRDYRCPGCGRLLFKADVAVGTVQIPCKDCRRLRTFPIATKDTPSHTTPN